MIELKNLILSISKISRKPTRVFSYFFLTSLLFLIPFSLSLYHGVHTLNAEASNPAQLFYDPVGYLKQSMADLLLVISGILLKFLIFLTSLASKFFTIAADYSTRGSIYSNLPFINTAWVFIRDLVNSTFIFIVLFAAIKELISFGSPNVGKLKDLLLKITVAALLINFSLFFTKVAIDASNYLSRTLVCRMQIVDPSKPEIKTCDPGEVLIAGLRLHTFDFDNTTKTNEMLKASYYGKTDQIMTTVFANVGGMLVGIIASIAFFTAAFTFMARIFILILLMATSPVMFAAMAINTKSVNTIFAKWKSELTAQLTFPIIFLLTIYLAVRFIRLDGFVPKAGVNAGGSFSFAEALVGTPNAFPIILNFGFVIILMLAGLKAARTGSGSAKILGDKASSFLANKTLAIAGAAGRQTAGRFAKNLSENDKLKEWSQKSAFNRFVGDKIIRGSKAVSGSSFDARNSTAFGATFGKVGKDFGLGFNKGSSKSFATDGRSLGAVGPKWMRDASAAAGFKMSKEEEEKINKAKSAELQEKHGYSGGMLASYAQSEFGDKIMDKEHKDLREEIVKKIREENKKDPKAAALALQKAFGKDKDGKNAFDSSKEFKSARQELAKDMLESLKEKPEYKDKHAEIQELLKGTFGDEYYKSKDFEDIRGQIAGEISKENLKGAIKGYTDKYDELSLVEKDISTTPLGSTALANLETKRQALKAELAQQGEVFQKASLNAKPDIVAELATKDIDKLHSQLKKAHLMAIQKKRATPGGYAGSEQDVDAMIQRMLLDEKNENPLLREQITAEIIKDTSPFEVNLQEIFNAENAKSQDGSLTKEQQKNARTMVERSLGAMKTNDLLKAHPSQILDHRNILPHLRPQAILEYRKVKEAEGDMQTLSDFDQMANDILRENGPNSMIMPTQTDKDKRTKIANALLGKSGGGGKKNRKKNSP